MGTNESERHRYLEELELDEYSSGEFFNDRHYRFKFHNDGTYEFEGEFALFPLFAEITTVEDGFHQLQIFKFDRWKDAYTPEGCIVLDGTEAEFRYKYNDGAKRTITCYNTFPSQWKKLIMTLDILAKAKVEK